MRYSELRMRFAMDFGARIKIMRRRYGLMCFLATVLGLSAPSPGIAGPASTYDSLKDARGAAKRKASSSIKLIEALEI
jgi:hypothetical protein